MSWTDERVELLRKLWTEGHSASQIAAQLGGVTRNAVIGKVHRLGLSGRGKSTRPSTARTKPQRTYRAPSRPTRSSSCPTLGCCDWWQPRATWSAPPHWARKRSS